jgi:hypothetical protein
MNIKLELSRDPSRTIDLDDNGFRYGNNGGTFGLPASRKIMEFLGDGFGNVLFTSSLMAVRGSSDAGTRSTTWRWAMAASLVGASSCT